MRVIVLISLQMINFIQFKKEILQGNHLSVYIDGDIHQLVKLQFIISSQVTQLLDVKWCQPCTTANQNRFCCLSRDEKSRTFSSNSKRSHILRTSSRSRRLILSSIVSFAVWLKWTRTIQVVLPICFLTVGQVAVLVAVLFIRCV